MSWKAYVTILVQKKSERSYYKPKKGTKNMAIEKMRLLNITGPEKELDRFIARNLLNSDLQIEDAKKIYNKGWKLEYYDYDYTIQDNLKKCQELIQNLGILYREEYSNLYIENTVSQIGTKIEHIQQVYEDLENEIELCQKDKQEKLQKIASVEKLEGIEIDIQKLYHLKYIKFRYGNIANDKLEDIREEIDKMNVCLFEIEKQPEVTWIVYVTTEEFVQNIDVFFNRQNFERVWLEEGIAGTPKEYLDKLYKVMSDKSVEMQNLQKELQTLADNGRHILLSSYRQLQTYDKINKIKKYMVHDSKNTFYLVAWLPETERNDMVKKLDMCPNIDYQIEEKIGEKSPTKLKNPKFIRSFESLVKMYGVPSPNEIDPTLFVALTAFLMFGFMFGDVGHGLVFFVIGILLRFRQKDAGNILVAGGISSTIFGFFYGSVFGKEDILKAQIIRPMANIDTMLVYGIIVRLCVYFDGYDFEYCQWNQKQRC